MTPNVLIPAVEWLQYTLLGTFATTAAIIAVAGIGFQALTGRIDLRTAARTLLGCFILFGATSIAAGLRQLATGEPPAVFARARGPAAPLATPTAAFDPYAGAAVPNRQ